MNSPDDLDDLWADLLSEDAERILATWLTLDSESQAAVHNHLVVMISDDGYAEGQRESAQAALDVIDDEQAADALL